MTQGHATPGWHPEDIKAALRKRGWTIARLGRALGYAQSDTPRKVFAQPWPYMEHVIANILGLSPAEIWPDRYTKNGSPRGTGIRKQPSIFPVPGRKQNGSAA